MVCMGPKGPSRKSDAKKTRDGLFLKNAKDHLQFLQRDYERKPSTGQKLEGGFHLDLLYKQNPGKNYSLTTNIRQ